MSLFTESIPSQYGNASPSVSLERGNYRMRAPIIRPPPLLLPEKRQGTGTPSRKAANHRVNRNLALLLMLLTLACMTCFGSAYYLFTTRWDSRAISFPCTSSNTTSQAIVFDTDIDYLDLSAKYLTYLPHSGFHNQRIAFENALLLSHLLRRTLLVPPIRLGNKPIHYVEYNTLSRYHELSSKEGLSHCAHIPVHITRPIECLQYFETSYIPWTWLVDLSAVSTRQPFFHRPNMSQAWLQARFGILSSDVYVLRDDMPYRYRFLDTLSDSSPVTDKYQEDVYITNLVAAQERLLQIGTLFGTSRLRLKNSDNIAYLEMIRRNMVFTNSDLIATADSISQSLHSYLGVHLRSGDGKFKKKIGTTVKAIWWEILYTTLGLSVAEICDVEDKLLGEAPSSCTTSKIDPDLNNNVATWSPYISSLLSYRGLCRSSRHHERKYHLLNVPIYVATDLKTPEMHPAMSIFRQTFPCMFFLDDFKKEMIPLENLISPYDGVNLLPFVLPFVDALVLGKALKVVGTEGSTFSKFVTEILWSNSTGN
ncbi:hypothetical protein CVT25_012727 [Psilocybe cyanescens]|uniref:CigA protein n=1 Tax=Psilocybe cyanescens TaxID=93625 RepID=A0A409XSG1_PSICY|nr:hypothetical protein CVT25_012727 [Psilocybe cyanescens]